LEQQPCEERDNAREYPAGKNPAAASQLRIVTKLKRAAVSLPFIFLVALLLRLIFAWGYAHVRPSHALGIIPFLFEPGNIAYALATGHGFSSPFRIDTGPTAWMTPIYPLLLAGIFHVFGVYTYGSFVAAALCNILFSALATIPIFFIGKRLGGSAVAVTAAWLWAVFPNAIVIPYRDIWDTALAALLASGILWATLALAQSKSRRGWWAYGLLWGFTLMTNPTLGSLLPLLLAWMALRRRKRTHWLVGPVTALAIACLCCVPWTVRNYRTFHALVPLRSVLGLQLWMGNNNQVGHRWTGELHPIVNPAERAEYIRMGEIPYMHHKRSEALHFITGHPCEEARLIATRFVATWTGGSEHPIRDFLFVYSWWLRFILLFNLFAAAGAALGIVLLYRSHSPYAFPIAIVPIVYPLISYVSVASPRYRHPIDPAILLLAAVSVMSLVEKRKSRLRLPAQIRNSPGIFE
jgi:4-amino-4-deoxy-L-arabinose transferase-like glycosyltransferase